MSSRDGGEEGERGHALTAQEKTNANQKTTIKSACSPTNGGATRKQSAQQKILQIPESIV